MTQQRYKQDFSQMLQQDDLNEVLGNMLSTAECLSKRYGKKKNTNEYDFGRYDLYDSGQSKNEEDLKSQLEIQTKIFRNNYYYMLSKSGQYPFPKNYGEKEIKILVGNWKENSKPENYIYFDNIIKILNKDFNLTYPKENIISNGIDPKVTADLFPKVMKDVNFQRKKVKKEIIENNGVYNNNLKIKEKCKNENFAYKDNKTNEDENVKLEVINFLDKIFKLVECYIYVLYIKKNNMKKSEKNCIKMKYGNKEIYDQYFEKNPSLIFQQLNNGLAQFKEKYKEYCLYYDTSKDKEIIGFKNDCSIWKSTFPNDSYIAQLYETLIGQKKGTEISLNSRSNFCEM